MSSSKEQSNDEDSQKVQEISTGRTEKDRTNVLPPFQGFLYQVQLLLWYLVNGASKNYNSFRLSTELKQVKKIYDIIFEYVENGKKIYRLVQVKHRRSQTKTLIKLNDDLLTLEKTKNDCSLLKYLRSYQELKNEEMFQRGEIKDLVFFTNIDFDLETKVMVYGSEEPLAIKDIVTKLQNEDDILDFTNINMKLERTPARYKFNDKMIPAMFQKILDSELQKAKNKKQKEKGLNLTEVFGIDKDKSLEKNPNFYKLIKEFFDHLVFAVNQPNKPELGSIIKGYITENFTLLPDNAYDKLFVRMQNWVVGEGNEFIAFQDLNTWFETLMNDFNETIKNEK